MNLYFDNAATSWPKPPAVSRAVADCIDHYMGNPNRSIGTEGRRILYDTRNQLASLLNIRDSSRIIFCFNTTHAINIGIQGLLCTGDHVVTTSMEHHAVGRILRHLERIKKITLDIVRCTPEGYLDPDDLKKSLGKPTRLVVVNHASNVTGSVNRLQELGHLVKTHHGIFMVDCAQSVGVVTIDVERDQIDLLAGPGHKNLLGPSGTGFLYIRSGIELNPLIFGGTGSFSERESQPDQIPDRFESGTPNFHGLAGLHAGLAYLFEQGVETIQWHESQITQKTLEELNHISGIRIIGPTHAADRLPIFSIITPQTDLAVIADTLYENYGIIVRLGLHCAPWAHQTAGTFPGGTLRISPGLFHTDEDLRFLFHALSQTISHDIR